MSRQYNTSKKELIEAFRFLLSQKNITVSDIIKKAVSLYEAYKLDMADCIIAAHSLKGFLASFDEDLLAIIEVKPYWK